ncbi:hypothetical protein DID76_03315 [Candidatus Marinamargulisbacteria bacterium SCGC AG-414-C22]|nr:hypothetical protein DID76_03315 [Candidatus Marinamargulisbacteria bacterium SCGC AG-414-C22]
MLACFSVTCLTSCGESLYGEAEEYHQSSEAQLEDAVSSEDYEAISEQMNTVINDSNASPDEVAEAYATLGESTLGEENINIIQLFSGVATLADEEVTDPVNVFNLLQLEADSDKLKIAADSFNTVNDMSGTSYELTNDQHIIAGAANLLFVLDTVQEFYDVSAEGEVTIIDSGQNHSDILDTLLVQENIKSYTDKSITAFQTADCFTDDQLESIENIEEAIDDLDELNTAFKSNNAININGETFDFSSTPNDENVLADALDKLFGVLSE